MGKFYRLLVLAAIASCVSAANAIQYLNLASGDAGLTGVSGTSTLTVGGPPIGPANVTNLIDFFPTNLIVGDGTGIGAMTYSFTYEVNNAAPPTAAIGIVLQGVLSGTGTINFIEEVYRINPDFSETLVASMGNTLFAQGKVLPRGNLTFLGNNYSYGDNEGFLPALSNYKIKKSFTLTVGPNWGANDIASISLVEQNHQPVPEPASMAILGTGIAALVARRRRRKL